MERTMSALVEFPPELYDPNAFKQLSKEEDFRLSTALAMMWFSQLAYETGQPDTISHARQIWEFDQIKTIAKHAVFKPSTKSSRVFSLDTRGVIGTKDGLMVVAFGGTDALVWENIWTDIDFLPEAGSDVHAGFQAAFDGVAQVLDEALQSKPDHLLIAGYSLGGAIAGLAAVKALES